MLPDDGHAPISRGLAAAFQASLRGMGLLLAIAVLVDLHGARDTL